MEKASQDKREKNTNYQPEMHVRNANFQLYIMRENGNGLQI